MGERPMLLQLSILFWMILDPIGMVPIFATTVGFLPLARQRYVIAREMIIALIVMILTLYFGKQFFNILQVDSSALSIAGGIILFVIGMQMTFAQPQDEASAALQKKIEPIVVPLAIPIMAGPGILTTIILYSGEPVSNYIVLGAIFIAWSCALPIVLVAPQIKKYIGNNGSVALERLFGYILVLISTQMFLRGIISYVS